MNVFRIILVGSSYEPLGLLRKELLKVALKNGIDFYSSMSPELAELVVVHGEKQLLIVCDAPESLRAGQGFVDRMEKKNPNLHVVNSFLLTGEGDRINQQMLNLFLMSQGRHRMH